MAWFQARKTPQASALLLQQEANNVGGGELQWYQTGESYAASPVLTTLAQVFAGHRNALLVQLPQDQHAGMNAVVDNALGQIYTILNSNSTFARSAENLLTQEVLTPLQPYIFSGDASCMPVIVQTLVGAHLLTANDAAYFNQLTHPEGQETIRALLTGNLYDDQAAIGLANVALAAGIQNPLSAAQVAQLRKSVKIAKLMTMASSMDENMLAHMRQTIESNPAMAGMAHMLQNDPSFAADLASSVMSGAKFPLE
jgi:hypothetical protein